MTELNGKVVEVIANVGYHLLNFLDGVDTTNYLEFVRTDLQFHSLAIVSDHEFLRIFNTFNHDQPFLVPEEAYENCLDEYDLIDFQLVPLRPYDLLLKQPIQRLYVHSAFTIEGFKKLARTYRTEIFKCYSRLLSFNTDFYSSDYGLIDFELYVQIIGYDRNLNDYEKEFFKPSKYFQAHNDPQHPIRFVKTVDEFNKNLYDRFLSVYWINAIDFSKFVIVGGSVINALCQSGFADTHEQDINLIYPSSNYAEYKEAVIQCIDNLRNITSQFSEHQIIVEKIPISDRFDIQLPCGIKLNFSYFCSMGHSNNTLCAILNEFDMDLCQVAYTGKQIICTFGFLQAVATKSFIVYSLHGDVRKDVCIRIDKYSKRGFALLEPIYFDGDFSRLMDKPLVPLYRSEEREIIDENGEVQKATTEYCRGRVRNLDTFKIQEAFITTFCPESTE